MHVIPLLQESTNSGFTTGGRNTESESAINSVTSGISGRKSDSKSIFRNGVPPILIGGKKYKAISPDTTIKVKMNVAATLFFIFSSYKTAAKIAD